MFTIQSRSPGRPTVEGRSGADLEPCRCGVVTSPCRVEGLLGRIDVTSCIRSLSIATVWRPHPRARSATNHWIGRLSACVYAWK